MTLVNNIPDLSNGTMVNSYLRDNSYITGIQCAFALESMDTDPQYAFLAQECRFENLLVEGDVVFGGIPRNKIFDRTPGELVVLQTWYDTFAFRTRGYLGKKTPHRTVHQNPSKINVEYVSPKYLSFDECLDLISSNRIIPRDLYMHISWGEGFNVFTQCKYINYPNPKLRPESRYLQPISGQACFYNGEEFFVAYVACCMTGDGSQHIEFCVRDSCSAVDLLHGARKLRNLFPILKKVMPIYFHEYVEPVVVQGECRFYTYSM